MDPLIQRARFLDAGDLALSLERRAKSVEKFQRRIQHGGPEGAVPRTHLLARAMWDVVTVGYDAGVRLVELRDQMRLAAQAHLDAQVGNYMPYFLGLVRLFGLDEQLDALGAQIARPGNKLSHYLLWEERAWLDLGYPANDWQREECEFIDRIVEQPETAPQTLVEFYTAWFDENLPKQTGVWAFEVAAVARMNRVDDSALAESDFYPHDLAHVGW